MKKKTDEIKQRVADKLGRRRAAKHDTTLASTGEGRQIRKCD